MSQQKMLGSVNWNLNVRTNNVRFSHVCNHFNNKLSFSVGIWNHPTSYVGFCHPFYHFNSKLLFSVGIWMSQKGCKVLWSLKSFQYWTVFFSWNLSVPQNDVSFCHFWNHFGTELFFPVEFECPNKRCEVLSIGIWMSPQRMQGSVIFVIISILNCLSQLGSESPLKGCKALWSSKSCQSWTLFFSWNLFVPTNDVRFCHLWNYFDTELSFSVGVWMSQQKM